MELKIRKNSEDYIVDTIGEMDLYNSYKLKELVNKMIEKGVKSIVLNLDQTEYIDSSGIGALIYIFSTTKKRDVHCCLCGVRGTVKKVIELTKLTNYFVMAQDVNDALSVIHEL